MLKNFAKPILYVSALAFFLGIVVSCEEDFTDIGTTIVNNNQFTTNDTIFEVVVEWNPVDSVQADGLSITGGALGQYLLGVYNNENYEKIEASIISQLSLPANLQLVDQEYGSDTTVVTTIDTVLLRLPYQATLIGNDAIGPEFQLDSIIGNQAQPFTLNVFQLESFLNNLDPNDPSQINSFFSDHPYDVDLSEKLNFFEDFQFTPNRRDTAQFVLRRLSNGSIYTTDTISYLNSNPYISIPLKKNRIKEIFLDQYGSSNLATQDALNNYFRGLKIQARGNTGSLMSLNLNNTTLQPVMDIYYTNTVIKGGVQIIDTISKVDAFSLGGIRTSEYAMTDGPVPAFNKVAVQGAGGSLARVTLMTEDQLEVLRDKNWLINDATLTLYVDEATVGSDTLSTPRRLFIFKDGEAVKSQLLDVLTEGILSLDGNLNLDGDRNPDSYTFKFTDYISELASRELDDLQPLGIKVFNPTDDTPTDSIVSSHSWNPKAVMLLNHEVINGARRATLKISYSERIEEND